MFDSNCHGEGGGGAHAEPNFKRDQNKLLLTSTHHPGLLPLSAAHPNRQYREVQLLPHSFQHTNGKGNSLPPEASPFSLP